MALAGKRRRTGKKSILPPYPPSWNSPRPLRPGPGSPQEIFYYRSAASAGALYPNEVYLSAHNVEGINSGLYYYDLSQKNLVGLRENAHPSVLSAAVLPSDQNDPGITFFITGIFNRSSWKYRKRAYRYVLLDAGHVLQNLFFAIHALNLPFSFGYDFVDHAINHLLGLDKEKEVCLAWIGIEAGIEGPTNEPGTEDSDSAEDLPQSIKAASLTARIEPPYSQITDIHESGKIEKQVIKKYLPSPYTLGLKTISAQGIDSQKKRPRRSPLPGCPVFKEIQTQLCTLRPATGQVDPFNGLIGPPKFTE